MKAEDTVRYLPNEYRECADEDGVMTKYKVPVHEPSFEAGYEAGFHKAAEFYPVAEKEGRREVVEWITSDPSYDQDVGGIDAVVIFKERWQSKVKGWGLDEVESDIEL